MFYDDLRALRSLATECFTDAMKQNVKLQMDFQHERYLFLQAKEHVEAE